MEHIDLFSGIGGFSLAAKWIGWKTVAHIEIEKYCKQILLQNFPNVKLYGDIREFDGTEYKGLIDIITGGFPCQPFSVAGRQQGKTDNRYLWPEMFRVIREVRSPFIVGENVPGIIGMELENICLALEGEGYEVQPFIIPSASIGAWDKRERVWIIAYNHKFRCNNEQKRQIKTLSDEIRESEIKEQSRGEQQCGIVQSNIITSNTESPISKQSRNTWTGRNGRSNGNSNSIRKGLQRYSGNEISGRQSEQERQAGQTNWLRNWIEVASELCRSNARIPHRMDRIKALGNSINPYVAYEIFKAIEEFNIIVYKK